MPKSVYNVVEDHRIFDGDNVVEDITSVTLPTITNPTTAIENIAGMSGDVDMPNIAHVEAMELSIAHNNGVNCRLLTTPGKHKLEFRIARQMYDVANGELVHRSVKYRIQAIHKESEKGDIEKGNPLGSTEKYSVLRYEEEIEGEVVTIIDIMAGVIMMNGQKFTDDIESLLA